MFKNVAHKKDNEELQKNSPQNRNKPTANDKIRQKLVSKKIAKRLAQTLIGRSTRRDPNAPEEEEIKSSPKIMNKTQPNLVNDVLFRTYRPDYKNISVFECDYTRMKRIVDEQRDQFIQSTRNCELNIHE